VYSTPISIPTTKVLRAAAFGTTLSSFIETNTYFINVTHTVPVVSVCSQGVFSLVANGSQTPANRIGGFELFEQDGTFIDEAEGDFNKHGNLISFVAINMAIMVISNMIFFLRKTVTLFNV
jgi:hypothetical protein